MDEAAFSEYVVARRPQLFRTACLLCGDPHRAEDVVTEVCHWARLLAVGIWTHWAAAGAA